MLHSSINIISNILADKQIPTPSIGIQPRITLPPIPSDPKCELGPYIKNFCSLDFTINYHSDETTNTLEMIKKNFDFSVQPKIVLKRFVSKSAVVPEEYLSHMPKEISLPTNTISKATFRLFVGTGVHDGKKKLSFLNKGCQIVSLYRNYHDIMQRVSDNISPLEYITDLLGIPEDDDLTIYGFQFFVTLKRVGCDKDENPYVTISTNMFRLEYNLDFTEVKCLKASMEDYYIECDEKVLEDDEKKPTIPKEKTQKMDNCMVTRF